MTNSSSTHSAASLADEIGRFAGDLGAFRADLERKLADQSARLDALDRTALSRPSFDATAAADAPDAKAISAYLRYGDESGLASLEGKALTTTAGTDGGHLVDPRTSDTITALLRGASSIREIANVVTVEAGAFDVLVDHGEFAAEWQVETSAAGETATPAIQRISIPLHELSALPKLSQRLLDDAAFDLESWLSERIAERFARAENAAFVSGTGSSQPTGFLTQTTVANSAWAWGSLGYVPTGAAAGFATENQSDALIDLIYSLGAAYRRNAQFVMNSTTAGVVRKFKDQEGRYLWSEAMMEGQPARLMGYPVTIAEEMPNIEADKNAIAFGDFRAGYLVVERPELRILRDPFSAKPNVLFYATKRVGGDVVDFAAIKLLKIAAS